ncbi:hypothetical protein KIL84_011769 [Mauremys mutica]|uniref:Uncharacterized protein n=1 Tax=Mauremys mutica TaxID=74926 RepID=A0A9D3XEB0_9SAUR|nr:hypothetical protein KIL84_011769 [Mauremys mutica]
MLHEVLHLDMTAKAALLMSCFQINVNSPVTNATFMAPRATNHLPPTFYPSDVHGTIIEACTSIIIKINHFTSRIQPQYNRHVSFNSNEINQCLLACRYSKNKYSLINVFLITFMYRGYIGHEGPLIQQQSYRLQ